MKRVGLLLVPLLLVARLGATAPVLGPEVSLPSFAGRDSYLPAAAFGALDGGGEYLVAWQAGRIGPGDLRSGLKTVQQGTVVAARLDAAGTVLDAAPIQLAASVGMQAAPRVVFGGGEFLVVWQDLRNGVDWDVYAARVGPAGNVLDPNGVLIVGGVGNQAYPRATWDGSSFVVVWQDFRTQDYYQVFAARLSAAGTVLDPDGGVLAASGRSQHWQELMPAVASREPGRSLLLYNIMTWSGSSGSSASVFLTDGGVQPGPSYLDAGNGPGRNAVPACLAAGQNTYLAAWRTDAPGGRGDAPNGSNAMVLNGGGVVTQRLYVSGANERIQAPDAVWDGQTYLTAWHETQLTSPNYGPYLVVETSRITEGGALAGPMQPVAGSLAAPAANPAVAADGVSTAIIAYEKHPATAAQPVVIAVRVATGR